jgi:cyclopropane fatty-acyl-phospholipid synthase-like methyltransferase
MRRIALIAAFVAGSWSAVSGQDPRYTNKLAPYVASPSRVVDKMLEMAKVKPGDTVYDLGSGDGRILIAAAERHAQAIGIEINAKLVAAATDEIARAGLSDRAKVIQGDVMTTDFSAATVITLYMDTGSNAKLRPQLEKYLKPGARIVSHDYEIPGWKPVKVEKTEEKQPHTIYLYEIAAKR